MDTNPTFFLPHAFFLLLALAHLINSSTATATALNDSAAGPSSSSCVGSIAECNQELEMLMESEISRRVLEQKKYISPGALKRDQPVCNGGEAGEPYSRGSGCLPEPSNTYNRGCSRYYRCRSDA
ncbi:UNVERIFIED_CONTAM: protein RALF-like 32 [Sesamum radiatum]|uniref:Protein RALF-like 32 n=1 Tax=Sesamum radiatum TaxID=300843 RepID=A0AAW2MWZ8_SESRA